ncbi:uncharacterized protein PG998_000411 [Apiospora kogelbergensis]|uniref:uncharacterized protein n=1 Tax=Apiospora kogelbergensis TaxID=1337665 RepID=UPI003131575E
MAEITTSSSLASAADPAPSATTTTTTTPVLPRVTIRFCTQCKWMLRAAYYAQELLSTFSTGLGEVALQPSTGGTFIVEILASSVTPSPATSDGKDDVPQPQPGSAPAAATQHRVLWDRTTKELKRRVRDVIEPNRDLGHVDRDHAKKPKPAAAAAAADASSSPPGAPASSVPATTAAAAPPQESILTSSSSSTPTVVRDTPRQGQSQPRKPVAAAGPNPDDDSNNNKNANPQQISSAAPGNVCEDCQ